MQTRDGIEVMSEARERVENRELCLQDGRAHTPANTGLSAQVDHRDRLVCGRRSSASSYVGFVGGKGEAFSPRKAGRE